MQGELVRAACRQGVVLGEAALGLMSLLGSLWAVKPTLLPLPWQVLVPSLLVSPQGALRHLLLQPAVGP